MLPSCCGTNQPSQQCSHAHIMRVSFAAHHQMSTLRLQEDHTVLYTYKFLPALEKAIMISSFNKNVLGI